MNARDRIIQAIDAVPQYHNMLEPVLDRVIALFKTVGERRVRVALDHAHAQVDDMADARRQMAIDNEARRLRADEPTVPSMPLDPSRNGAGHE